MQKTWKITETLANGYASESTRRELSNEYQHDRAFMVFTNVCVFVLWTKVASALEGLMVVRKSVLPLVISNIFTCHKEDLSYLSFDTYFDSGIRDIYR